MGSGLGNPQDYLALTNKWSRRYRHCGMSYNWLFYGVIHDGI